MLKVNIQLFAHKKGMGSTKNGREATVSLSSQATFLSVREEQRFILAQT